MSMAKSAVNGGGCDVFEATQTCRQSLEQCLAFTSSTYREWVENRLADFNLWAAGIGASSNGRASLDARLSLEPEIRAVVVNLLTTLNGFIRRCNELDVDANNASQPDEGGGEVDSRTSAPSYTPADPITRSFSPWSDVSSSDSGDEATPETNLLDRSTTETIEGTQAVLGQLAQLAVAIRKSGTSSRLQKADRKFKVEDNENLRRLLVLTLLRDGPGNIEEIGRQDGGHRYKDMTATLDTHENQLSVVQWRLLESNLRRRNRFLYAQQHADKMAAVPAHATIRPVSNHGGGKRHVPASNFTVTSSQKSAIRPGRKQKLDSEPTGNQNNTPNATDTTASAVGSNLDANRLTVATPQMDTSTQVSSTAMGLSYPKPPKVRPGLDLFKCPCCCQILPSMFAEQQRWRKHISQDICPYTCPLHDCPKPQSLYITRNALVDHMLKDHPGTQSWECFACKNDETFGDVDIFKAHIRDQHGKAISDDQIPTLIDVCSRTAPPSIPSCPLCSEGNGMSQDALLNHVIECVHDFSLRSLPWRNVTDEVAVSSEGLREINDWLVDITNENTVSSEGIEQVRDWLGNIGGGVIAFPVADSEDTINDVDDYFKLNDYFDDEMSEDSSLARKRDSKSDLDSEGIPSLWTNTLSEEEPIPTIVVGGQPYRSSTFPAESHSKGLPIIDEEYVPLASLLRKHTILTEPTPFWTSPLLRHIMSRERILHQLKMYTGLEDSETYLDHIRPSVDTPEGSTTRTYLKIFALLLLLEKGEEISNFVEEQVSDESLPVLLDRDTTYLCHKKPPHDIFDCFAKWKIWEREDFENRQWQLLVPYFELDRDGRARHYSLAERTVLPWRRNSERFLSSSVPSQNDGGYASVSCVKIDPTGHDFHDVLKAIHLRDDLFAVKTLRDNDFNDEARFRNELEQLQRFNGLVHENLVTLLATFAFEGSRPRFSFLFPYAECALDQYWDSRNPQPIFDIAIVRWVSKQCMGIIGAIETIHVPQHVDHTGIRRYGRHGDIKPDNILLFNSSLDPKGILVVSDMGLTSFNRESSRSNIPNSQIPGMPGYRPPECDVEGGTISRAFDIWTLGCLFLEELTWLLGGLKLIDEFKEKRTTIYITGAKNAIFFDLKQTMSGERVAQVKEEVTQWLDTMHNHPNCSRFIHDALDIIEHEMLVVLSHDQKRSSSTLLREKFQGLHKKCLDSEGYCTHGVPGMRIFKPTTAVVVSLTSTAEEAIKKYHTELPIYKGEGRKGIMSTDFDKVVSLTIEE